jgi:hypothetical protein
MKILYVFTTASIQAGSVQNKVIEQIKALRQSGADCKGLFLTTDDAESKETELYDFIKVPRVPKTWFRSAKQKTAYHKTLYEYFITHQPQCDFIYCRYPGAGKFIALWTQLKHSKVFFEHLTSEGHEIDIYAKENPFKWNLSSILSHFEFRFLPLFHEWRYGKSIRKNAVFGIANSENIAEYENAITGTNYVRMISGDAVNAKLFPVRKFQPEPDVLRMIFLKGAVTHADFNGLDRLFMGMSAYKGNMKLQLRLYGRNLESEKRQIQQYGIQDMVELNGFIDKKGIDEIMNSVDLGVGALGVHRKGLQSTTTIKAREYFARGLPFFYGHNDPDFSTSPTAKNFCLEYEANDTPIDMEHLIQWYSNLEDQQRIPDKMHQFAVDYLDYNIKMQRLFEFLKTFDK